jgi:hypothetical protein
MSLTIHKHLNFNPFNLLANEYFKNTGGIQARP